MKGPLRKIDMLPPDKQKRAQEIVDAVVNEAPDSFKDACRQVLEYGGNMGAPFLDTVEMRQLLEELRTLYDDARPPME